MNASANKLNSFSDKDLANLVNNGSDCAFNELVVRYLGTINAIAHNFSAQGYEHSDFVQEGLLGLLYSCQTYEQNAGASFKSYMSLVVKRRFISIIRRSYSQKAVPKSALVQLEDIDEQLEDVSQSPEELVLCREHLATVMSSLKKLLSKTEYEILMLYGSGLSYREIAGRLSITEKAADNALQRARRKISGKNMS